MITVYYGYFNYFILPNRKQVKSYHFDNLDKQSFEKLKRKFSNPEYYQFCGCIVHKKKITQNEFNSSLIRFV